MVEKYNHCLVNLKPYYTNAQFYAFPLQERWAIRVSDGIWITPEKLIETTLTKKELKANPSILGEATSWLETLVECKCAQLTQRVSGCVFKAFDSGEDARLDGCVGGVVGACVGNR